MTTLLAEIPGLRDLSPPWLERLAALWPGREALTNPHDGTRYTFGDLRQRARWTASGLARRGVGPGDRVVALMHNSVAMLDLLFACAYLGAIFVPLNWRLSARETAGLLDETEPRAVVVGADLVELARAPGRSAELVLVEDPGRLPEMMTGPDEVEIARRRMADPWLILFTGGTTGIPKGAVLTHGSITWNAINTAVSWGLSATDAGPSLTPMFHTGGWNVFTLPLLMLGGRAILPQRFDPASALRMIATERPTVFFAVPTMFQLMAEEPEFERTDMSSLRWAISGGAPLPDPVYDAWTSKVRVFKQGYGLTEVGPNNFAMPDADAGRKRGTVGRLTCFAAARIVDDEGRDVPDGTRGELLLAGPHMCAGYWRRPDATAAAIRDGWFHTGDIAVRDDEGFYSIVDRKKDMIITGGENVYPTEVERVLYEHSAVREAAVVGVPDKVWGEAVTAVVSLKSGRTCTAEELRRHMRAHLARYKVPKEYYIVDDLPKSAAGKILRVEARSLIISNAGPRSGAR
jgi:fatty-acyl-CoA synthase